MPHLRDSFIVAKVGIVRSTTALLCAYNYPPLQWYEACCHPLHMRSSDEYDLDSIPSDKEQRLRQIEEHLLRAITGEPIDISQEELDHGDIVSLLEKRLKAPK